LPARTWYKRFRAAAYVNAVVWLAWTVAILLPFPPFSYLQPIIVGSGPGVWFLVGYILFVTVSVVGFTAISSLSFVMEVNELRELNYGSMLVGFILLYAGTLIGCILLGIAGAIGGYVVVIQGATADVAHSVLAAYVDPITVASVSAVAGAALTIYGMATAKASKH